MYEKGTAYAELGLVDPKWTDDELLDFVMAHLDGKGGESQETLVAAAKESPCESLDELRRPPISTAMQHSPVREKLIQAAVDIIHQCGFNGCGVQDIVDAAGVPKGSFYNHFTSKEALGAAAIERYWDERASVLLGMLADETVVPSKRLRRYLATIRARLADRGYASGCLVGNLAAELSDQSPQIAGHLSCVFARWTAALEGWVRAAQAAGEISRAIDPAMVARFLVNSLHGAILRARVDKSDTSLADLEAMISAMLFTSTARGTDQ